MEQSPKIVVDKMLAAFSDGNVEAIVETVSEDTLWIYSDISIEYSFRLFQSSYTTFKNRL